MMGKIKNVPHHQPEILLYIIKLYHDYYFDDDGDYDCDCDSDDDNRCVCSLPSTTTRTHFKLDPTLGCPGQLPSTKKKIINQSFADTSPKQRPEDLGTCGKRARERGTKGDTSSRT